MHTMSSKSIKCLITAGPTREFFDPVRFISNPSSGKMGFAIATAAAQAGWDVTLVSGPVALPAPQGLTRIDVTTGEEMFRAVDARFDSCHILIMTAAICDIRPKGYRDAKVKKHELPMHAEFEPVVDILKTVAARKQPGQTIVGFAAETDNVEQHAREKLSRKNCDLIAANRVGRGGLGFEADENTLLLIPATGEPLTLGPGPKDALGRQLIEHLKSLVKETR